MRLFLLLLLFPFLVSAQTSFTLTTSGAIYQRPGHGPNNWNDGFTIAYPPGGSTGVFAGIDRYDRFNAMQIQHDDGTYDWTTFDNRAGIAIANNQKFSFGYMVICEGCSPASGVVSQLTYPNYVHVQMQAESVHKDWKGTDTWVANPNADSYIAWQTDVWNHIIAHINSTTLNGVALSKAVYMIDYRPFGNFGECHFYPYSTQGMPIDLYPLQPQLDTLTARFNRIFHAYRITAMHLLFNTGGDSHVPAESGAQILLAQSDQGYWGIRRDSWGDATNYLYVMDNNTTNSNGVVFNTSIMNRYKTAPMNGEPLNGLASYHDLIREATLYGLSSLGNGNIANSGTPSVITDFQTAGFAMGGKLQVNGGSYTAMHPGQNFQLILNWQNTGTSPYYEAWKPDIELRNGATVLQKWTSAMVLKYFMGSQSKSDNFALSGSVNPGTYGLFLKIRDSTGYRKGMQISNTPMLSDTSYQLTTVTVTTGGGANPPPTANAGTDQNVTGGATSATLGGSTAAVSPAVSVVNLWSQVSGPNTATITTTGILNPVVSGLTPGVYIFQLKATDNLGQVTTDNVTVTVTGAHTPPNLAIANGTITAPVNSIFPSISASPVSPANLLTYVLSFISGPATPTIVNPATSTPQITLLSTAGSYIFEETVTDNNATPLHTTKRDTITVNAALPGCNCVNSGALDITNKAENDVRVWGRYFVYDSLPLCIIPTVAMTSNYTVPIVPPISTVAFAYSGKSNNHGSGKMIYTFTQVSGPTASVNAAVLSRATVSGLQVGTSVFALTAKDDCGAVKTIFDTIVVKPPVIVAKTLFKAVYVPGEKQYNLTYTDGSVQYVNLLPGLTLKWVESDMNTHTFIMWYTDANGTLTKQTYQ